MIRCFWMLIVSILMCGTSRAADSKWVSDLQPYLKQHCYDCHANGASEGGLDLSTLSTSLDESAAMAKWIRVHDRVESGEMPPSDADQPSSSESRDFLKSLSAPLVQAHQQQKGTALRRLNRQEYENTMNAMFHTHLDFAATLPEDGRSHEFSNVGESLNISVVQMQKYLDAAKWVLETAIENRIRPRESKVVKSSYATGRDSERFLGKQWFHRKDGAVVFYQAMGYPNGMLREANFPQSGRYRVKIEGDAYQSDKPISFVVRGVTFQRGAENPTFGYFSFPPGKSSTIEFEVWGEERYMLQIQPIGLHDPENKLRNSGIKAYRGPGLAIKEVTVEGPLSDGFPNPGHRFVFDGIDREEIRPRNPRDRERPWYQPKFTIDTVDPVGHLMPGLKRIATRAFRRPVTDAELQPYEELLTSQIRLGSPIEDAYRTAITAILCSPDFLYLVEKPGRLDDYALAARLSYFLTRSPPDDELLSVAASGRLSTDESVLLAQLDRLLKHEHHDRFITDFTDAWLDLRNIDFTNPDDRLYPEFDLYLKWSMLQESRAWLKEMIASNHGIRHVVESDFAMLNERLAEHYGIPGVNGTEVRKVTLPGNSVRGGVLTQGSVLKVSANGTNTSPVVRGVWVMERILGTVPPPPPPGIPGVEPDIRGATTLRELLDKHRDSVSCRSCHQMIDPPGFALESFNPIGGWRENFRSLEQGERLNLLVKGRKVRYKRGLPVDSSGELTDGRDFDGYLQFRSYLAADEKRLAKAFTKKLLTFATGREPGFSDRAEIDRIVDSTQGSQHGMRDLIRAVILSDAFRNK